MLALVNALVRRLGLAVVLLVGACSSSEGEGARTPTAGGSSPSATSAEVADGVVVALIQASDGAAVTWDQLEARGGACGTTQSEARTYQESFEACYANADPALRTAPLDRSAQVVVRPGNGPERTVGAGRLPEEVSEDAANDVPRRYRVWRLEVSGGRVVRVEQVAGAST